MTTMWDTNTITISDLIRYIENSKIALPSFQRPSVWSRSDWLPFLTTVLRDRPTGTLLLLEAGKDPEEFAPRHLNSAPPIDQSIKWLLLDGQQRTTTIWKAFKTNFPDKKGNNPKVIVLDVKAALSRGELWDEDLKLESVNVVPAPAVLAQNGRVELKTLLDPGQLLGWNVAYAATHIAQGTEGQEELFRQLAEIIPGFASVSSYKFPYLDIKEETPLDVVVDIFEGMNRRGQKLNQFDLMVARLYKQLPDGKFYNLRERWEEALSNSASLLTLGIAEDDGMLPLQLIAMQVSRLPEGMRPAKIKGLNNADVLELPASQIIEQPIQSPHPYQNIPGLNLVSAVKALDDAAKFLISKCGVVDAPLLPQLSMLIPLADQFLRPQGSRLSEPQLKKWFFCTGLLRDYYGGVNSFVHRDCRALELWASSNVPPGFVTQFDRQSALALDLKQPMNREGAILGKTIMAMLISKGALDWKPGQLGLNTTFENIEFHHMIPDKKLKTWFRDKEDRRPIANMTPITGSINASIGDKDPAQVINGLAADAMPIVNSHRVDSQLLINAVTDLTSFNLLLDDRQKRLRELVIETLAL